ncbi:MAG TPA: methionyl-tRNA formyltransferase [Vicinamibacterales bacterium]|nr:methionyl-tRNA formyltransferase [Vicinamibacterales bacterium]
MVEPRRLRVAFFGTPAFAVPTLEALLRSRHPVVVVVSQPDRPSGRGHRIAPTPIKAVALEAGIPVLQPERLRDERFREAFTAFRPDLGVVAAYGKLLPEWLIAIPPLGLINVHASLLPKYRGAAPIQRAIMAGERETGVTIMRIVKDLDAGAMFAREVRPIPEDATSADIEKDLAEAGARLLVDVVDAIADGTAVEEPQDDRLATFAPKISKEDGFIQWNRSAREIHNQVRALVPWPRAWTHIADERVMVIRTAVEDAERPNAEPGEVLEASGDVLRIATGSGVLRILELQPEGRRVMSAREFLAGRPLRAGVRFS